MKKATQKTTKLTKMAHRRGRQPRSRAGQAARWLAGHSPFLLLALAVLFGLSVMALAGNHGTTPGSAPGISGAPQTTTSGAATALPAGWTRLASHSPADILAAARQSPLLQTSSGDGGDHPSDFSRLGTPVLVLALRTAQFGTMPDFYVVPVLNAAGQTTDAVELQLDAGHTAIQVIAVVTYAQPRPAGRVAALDPAAAVAAVSAQHHVALKASAQPALVYLPMDTTAGAAWSGGGASPVDPVWMVPGADGQSYVVGSDAKAYYLRDLPGNPQTPG